jgi:hypothetical protein
MTHARISSALSGAVRPVRELFDERHSGRQIIFTCKLCRWQYSEESLEGYLGWAVSVNGLFLLVKHLRGHVLN